jgi:MerR family transcriptional regulator/heat shock protein HspR
MLREIARLSQEEGVNLAGIKRIMELETQVDALRARVSELLDELAAVHTQVAQVHASYRRDLVPVSQSALVVWRPPKR